MGIFLVFLLILQSAPATPVGDATIVISEREVLFPALEGAADPVSINIDWELLYYNVHASSDGYIIRGEVRNVSANPLTTPTFVVTLEDGSQIGIVPDIDQVKAGGRAPFHHAVHEDEVTAALNQSQNLEFSDACEFYEVVPLLEYEWGFTDVELEFEAERAAVRVTGSVTNLGENAAERIVPMVFAFTSDGHYIGSVFSRDAAQTIFSGDSFEFSMNDRFDSYHSGRPFAGISPDAQFIVAMSSPTIVSLNCVG